MKTIEKKVLYPEYYDKFACIGADCEETCCQNWAITIDRDTYMKYRTSKDPALSSAFRKYVKRIKGGIESNFNYAVMTLREDGFCPLLREGGLCSLHADYGPEYLSLTCRSYPRLFNVNHPDFCQFSLTSSCPEVVRIALFDPNPIGFKMDTTGIAVNADNTLAQPMSRQVTPESLSFSWTIQQAVIDILQNRNYPLNQRLFFVGIMLRKLDALVNDGETSKVQTTCEQYVSAAREGLLDDIFSETESGQDIQTILSIILVNHLYNESASSSTQSKIYRSFWTAYGNNEPFAGKENEAELIHCVSDIYSYIKEKSILHYPTFLAEKDYILENYFVNYVFSSVFPFTFASASLGIYHHFIILAQQYAIIRALLCVNAGEEGITDELIVKVLTSVTMVNNHGATPQHIAENYIEAKLDSLAHMSFLLRDM